MLALKMVPLGISCGLTLHSTRIAARGQHHDLDQQVHSTAAWPWRLRHERCISEGAEQHDDADGREEDPGGPVRFLGKTLSSRRR